jgi:2-polyprenyl-3-methyl-5-hydroxy-6-metoxy-1,4-benzoquinol methylase
MLVIPAESGWENSWKMVPETMTWNRYLASIQSPDTFVTRYFHYLRVLSVFEYFQNTVDKKGYERCLDIGCNKGYFSRVAAEYGMTVDTRDCNID